MILDICNIFKSFKTNCSQRLHGSNHLLGWFFAILSNPPTIRSKASFNPGSFLFSTFIKRNCLRGWGTVLGTDGVSASLDSGAPEVVKIRQARKKEKRLHFVAIFSQPAPC